MKYGLKDNEVELIQSILALHPEVEKAVLYGSRAKSNYRAASDIDLTLLGKSLDVTMLLAIENELDDLLLPYKIDLSLFNKIQNQDLIEHIRRIGIVFYQSIT